MIRVKKIHSGFSVLEVLISALILLILMSISSEIMYQSLRISREERGLAFIRKEAIKVINWLNNDLRRSNSASFSYKIDPVINVSLAMSCLTNQENVLSGTGTTSKDPNGTQVIASPRWYGYVVYYLVPDVTHPATAEATQKYLLKRAKRVGPSDSYYNTIFSNSYYSDVFNPYMSSSKELQDFDLATLLNKWAILSDSDKHRPDTIARNIYKINVIEKEQDYIVLTVETRDKEPRGGEMRTLYSTRILMRNSNLQAH